MKLMLDYHSRQAQMEKEADEHVVSVQDQGNLSVLAFVAMLGDEAIQETSNFSRICQKITLTTKSLFTFFTQSFNELCA